MDRTAPLRNDSNSESLFIGSNKPHKPVSSLTIGRWIKEQLKEASIDTSVFSAHSARGAAASKAMNRGVPIQSILNLGHWSRESTFARFYKRTVPENTDLVGASILHSPEVSRERQIQPNSPTSSSR
jgi:site-specific recombinase XerD